MIRSARALSLPGRSVIAATLLALSATACSKDATSIVTPVQSGSLDPSAAAPTASMSPIIPTNQSPFWVDPYSNATKTATAWRTSRAADATQLDKLASQPTAKWFGNWNTNIQADVNAATTAAVNAGKIPLFVAYNIPQRDCGGLSGGNLITAQNYKPWITAFANGIGNRRAVVVLEPDALAGIDCLSAADANLRYSLLVFAVQTFAAKLNTTVYLDGGNPRWRTPAQMAARLNLAGVSLAAGFALNVSNFYTTAENVAYGYQISSWIGGKHYIVDTSRNGLGPTSDNQWCNPAGRALGDLPSIATGNALVDAYLWIKAPGESDGACNGNPSAGAWMPDYAVGLAQRAAY